MYDYDDYDDDYVAPPKQKAKPKSATGVKQVATDNKQQSKTIQKQAPVASKVSKTTAVSTNTSKAASADTTSNSLGLGSSSSPTKTSPDEVNTKIISSSTPTSTEHTSQGNVSDDDEPSISTESQQDSLPKVSIIITGHVDAGKSTMLGNLLVQIGNIAKRTIQKYQKESEQIGKGSFALAWVMDECQSERTHGVTIGLAERCHCFTLSIIYNFC